VDVPPTLAQQLLALRLSPDPCVDAAAGARDSQPRGRADELTEALGRLGREVVAVVPSCVAVSIAASRLGIDVVITAPTSGVDPMSRTAEVLASLTLPLTEAGVSRVLVLQASTPGAFVLLAQDLATLLASGHQLPELDARLAPLAASSGSALAESLADLSLLDRALGVLIDQGWPPEAGEREMHRRASVAGLTVAAVAERLLASPSPAAPHGTD
jgi:hypothetical protein